MKLTKSQLRKIIKEELAEASERFTGGPIDIEPLDDATQEEYTEEYYKLFDYLRGSALPGEKPSEKLKFALRWIAKFEQGV